MLTSTSFHGSMEMCLILVVEFVGSFQPEQNTGKMPSILEPVTIPKPVIKKKTRSDDDQAPTFYVICWNDPVNLMVFVTHVFMKIFGWNKQKAEKHMMEVHEKGKSVLVREEI